MHRTRTRRRGEFVIAWFRGKVAEIDGSGIENALSDAGVPANGIVAGFLGSTPAAVAAHIACRGTYVPVSLKLPPDEVARRVSDAHAVLAVPETRQMALETGKTVIHLSRHGAWVGTDRKSMPDTHGSGTGIVRVWSSGSTGLAHSIDLSEGMRAAHAAMVAKRIGHASAWAATLGLHHVGGVMLLDRAIRDHVDVILAEPGDVYGVAHALGQASHASLVPTQLRRLTAAPSSLQCVLLGGDGAPADWITQHVSAGWPLHPTYGLSEACGQVATALPDEALARAGTVGRPLDGLRVQVSSNGLVVEGPSVQNGRVQTGDVGYLEDGFLYVAGRVHATIITGGEKVQPERVEAVLREAPGVDDVAVWGVPDETWGERVVAGVVATAWQPDAWHAWAKAHLAPAERPKEWTRLEVIPRTENGKIRRHELPRHNA